MAVTASPVSPQEITQRAVASFGGCHDARLRELLSSLVSHLHAFVNEVGLGEHEWNAAIEALAHTGDDPDGRVRQLVMFSDTLGVSMLLDALAHPKLAGATESTVLGPFHVPGAPLHDYGESIVGRQAGIPAWVHGTVTSTTGEPIPGAELDVWQNGDDGLYAVQDREGPEDHLRGRFRTRRDGSYALIGVRPTPYQIPTDGQAGRMLKATGRLPWRPAHIHMIVTAEGYEPLTTHIFDADSPYLDTDPVFAVKPSLLRQFEPRSAEDPERPAGVSGEWYSVRSDIVLMPSTTPVA